MKLVCPGCREVIIGLGIDSRIECCKCGTVIDVCNSLGALKNGDKVGEKDPVLD